MSKRDALESALLTHGSEWWDDNDRGLYADEIVGLYPDLDAMTIDDFAFTVWSMGYTSQHTGFCRYRDDKNDPSDADYENGCTACEQELVEMGRKVIADLAMKAADAS